MLIIQDVLDRFEGVRGGANGQWDAKCPCHDDRKQSLRIKLGDGGRILIYDQAGCQTEDVLSAVKLTWADIMPEREEKKPGFDYDNIVDRYEYRNGTRKLRDGNKHFVWQHFDKDNRRWVNGRGDAPHVLYMAGNASDTVLVCEGEKDTINASKVGYWAVSSENGAGKNSNGKKWFEEYTKELEGRSVVIVPDNDDVGREYAVTIAMAIRDSVQSIKIINLRQVYPELPEKGDISDVIEAMGPEESKRVIDSLIDSTPDWEPEPAIKAEAEAQAERAKVYDMLIKRAGKNGAETVAPITENFLTVLRNDSTFAGIRYNIMRAVPERVEGLTHELWTDADDARARTYIELHYSLSNPTKYKDAISVFETERAYHPAQELINSIKWDGNARCESFLIKWLGCEDTPYNRECSRLIFAGGINRAFRAGCKFDCVIVLIGDQGGGKSTMLRWLAMDESLFSSARTISGQKGVEAIDGKWIVELEELLAVLANERGGTKVEENAKAFLTNQIDTYRRPYAVRPDDVKRNCIFIGTTNRSEFLTDKTGNRRWYPVRCKPSIEYIISHEAEAQEDIRQAWAEMAEAYRKKLPMSRPTEDRKLLSLIREEQHDAEVDDWRVGKIEKYLEGKNRVCLKELWDHALYELSYPPPYDSNREGRTLGEIMLHQLGWVRGGPEVFPEYGKQKAFRRPSTEEPVRTEPAVAKQESFLPVNPPDNPFS